MKLQFSVANTNFRQQVRDFVRANLPEGIRTKIELGVRLERAELSAWIRILQARGWSTPAWPREYGGPGWTPLQRHIFDEEIQACGAPPSMNAGINMLGPVLIAFGSEAQKACYLPAIRRGETWWAQGFSEPNAGSDLASLRTAAVLEGDHFIVNGHKIWTSYAHFCEMIFCLVRTDPAAKPQAGISFLLMDLKSPGITVRPIKMIDGGNDLNEVFFDNVRVPAENLIGEPNKGWTYAKYLLGFERTGIAGIGACKQQLARLKNVVTKLGLQNDAALMERIATLEIEAMALAYTSLRFLSANQSSIVPQAQASMLKLRGTELRQSIFALLDEVVGEGGLVPAEFAEEKALASVASNHLDSRKLSIFGGSNEIQRGMIARALFAA
ncbi:MAG: acyl-CoA dehydrogenase family protein [Burkholderiales bacterium]